MRPTSINSLPGQSKKSTRNAGKTVGSRVVGVDATQTLQVPPNLQNEKLKALINLETEARSSANVRELAYIISNNTRSILPVRQVFVFQQKSKNAYRLSSISSIAEVEQSAFMVRALEKLIQQLAKSERLDAPITFALADVDIEETDDWKNYPFNEFHWQPFSSAKSHRFAGMLLARDKPWTEKDQTVSAHLADIYSHAWRALVGERRLRKVTGNKSMWIAICGAALLLCGFIPVPLTALAPAEIKARDAILVTAPIDGIIDEVLVSPNAKVARNQPLIRFEDSTLRNDVLVAERNVEIAQARERQFNQSAFSDEQASRKLTVATSELELAKAQLAYNKDVLTKTIIRAPDSGIAVFKDTDEWRGRPVHVGTRILRVANPQRVELEIYLPVSDAIVVVSGSRVRFFLDTSPLNPLEARLVSASYQASRTASGALAYILTADLIADNKAVPRIGLRGVAQLFGEQVPLYFFLFRKPLATLRQFLGV